MVSPQLLSIFLMIVSVGMLAGIDSVVIIVAKDGMHPFQIVFFRCLFGLAALTPLFMATKTNPLLRVLGPFRCTGVSRERRAAPIPEKT